MCLDLKPLSSYEWLTSPAPDPATKPALAVVCLKRTKFGKKPTYGADHVNVLRAMVSQHNLPPRATPHGLLTVTDKTIYCIQSKESPGSQSVYCETDVNVTGRCAFGQIVAKRPTNPGMRPVGCPRNS